MGFFDVPAEQRLTARHLIAEILEQTPSTGPNETARPGLTIYRFERPQAAQWAEVHSLAICCVVQGRKRFIVDEQTYECGPFHYLLFTRGMRFAAEILEATPEQPYLSFVLQIDPAIVRSMTSELAGGRPPTLASPLPHRPTPPAHLFDVNENLLEAFLRFLRAVGDDADQRILAPMYLREIVYRLLRADQVSRLLRVAADDRDHNPVRDVIAFAKDHMAQQLTVADLARHAGLSPSSLTALFAETLGVGPYQFLKRMRLDRASALLMEGDLNVSEVAKQVGYTSLSHFITEFKRMFGTTPRGYAESQRHVIAMRVDEATRPLTARH